MKDEQQQNRPQLLASVVVNKLKTVMVGRYYNFSTHFHMQINHNEAPQWEFTLRTLKFIRKGPSN